MGMVRGLFFVALFLFLPVDHVFAEPGKDGTAEKSIYFLKDDVHDQWCAYSRESRFKEQVQFLVARVVGGVDFSDDHILRLHVTETDETGDWTVYDDYAFDGRGKIHSLRRTINILPENTSEEQLFVIENGKAIKQRSVYRQLGPGKSAQKSVDWFKSPQIIVSFERTPFSVLIGSKRPEVLSKGELCIRTENRKQ